MKGGGGGYVGLNHFNPQSERPINLLYSDKMKTITQPQVMVQGYRIYFNF